MTGPRCRPPVKSQCKSLAGVVQIREGLRECVELAWEAGGTDLLEDKWVIQGVPLDPTGERHAAFNILQTGILQWLGGVGAFTGQEDIST